MSFASTGKIPDRLSVDYAPTGRASCKSCGALIRQGSVRVGEKVRSPWHDGFDTKYMHSRCGLSKGSSVHDFSGFQRLRWADQMALGEKLHRDTPPASPQEAARLKRINELLWEVKAHLSVPKKVLMEVVQHNDILCSEKTPPASLLHMIADGLICGKLPKCPWCQSDALEQEGTLVRCYGYVNGATRCSFKASAGCLFGSPPAELSLPADFGRTGAWKLTPHVQRALQKFELPADAPVRALAGGTVGAVGFTVVEEGEPSEDEADAVPNEQVMAGMCFASVGSTSPSAAELQTIVQAHGGEWFSGSLANGACITHLVATETEACKPKNKRSVKFQAAVDAGVPIVSTAFVLSLANVGGMSVVASGRSKRKSDAMDVASDEDDGVAAMKVGALRLCLAEHGMDISGKKSALVERLREAKRAAARVDPGDKRAATEAKHSNKSGSPNFASGVLLRQRKYLAPYLLLDGGQRGARLPTIAQAIARKPVVVAVEPTTRQQLPPIEPGSALLRSTDESALVKPKVYVDEYNLAYNCVLNLMDIRSGINKFYKMQLLTHTKTPHYSVWKSWGRVGGDEADELGVLRTNDSLVHHHRTDLSAAKKEFHEKFRELARIDFWSCEPPCQMPGGYAVSLIPGQHGSDVSKLISRAKLPINTSVAPPLSQLPDAVRDFVQMIFSEKMMKAHLEEQHIDLDKMPLGSISDVQIRRGYEILTQLANELERPATSLEQRAQQLLAHTNAFYNVIPHKFSWRDTPPVIDTIGALQAKLEMIESLLQISKASRISCQLGVDAQRVHPADANYAHLQCDLSLADDDEIKMVKEYAANTHAETHSTYRMKVEQVFRASRLGEAEKFRSSIGNRKLLWHGSRLTNFVGILSQGLRIAPPEAPSTGYMFGKGVYFADMASKSANYCMATSENSTAVLLLCDVALGEQFELLQAEYNAQAKAAKKGKHSTYGIGKTCPHPSGTRVLPDGVHVPMGKASANEYLEAHLERLKAESKVSSAALLYNEFIVYDISQIRIRYVVVANLEFINSLLD